MNKIKFLIISLLTILVSNNVSAQKQVSPWTRVNINPVIKATGVDLSTADMVLHFYDVYLPQKPTQDENLIFDDSYLLPGTATLYMTHYYMGHGTLEVSINGPHAWGRATVEFSEDSGSDYCNTIHVTIDVYEHIPQNPN